MVLGVPVALEHTGLNSKYFQALTKLKYPVGLQLAQLAGTCSKQEEAVWGPGTGLD